MAKKVLRPKKRQTVHLPVHDEEQELTPMQFVPQVENTPDRLLAMGIQQGLDLEKLEKLMELNDKWHARKAKEAYYIAFAKFQSISPELIKNKQVSFQSKKEGAAPTNYKYQELADIAKHIRPALAECGLSYKWIQDEKNGEISVTCIVAHISGHEEKGFPLVGRYDDSGNKNQIQQKASTITYLRRYTLTGMLGLSTGEGDNDGAGGAKAEAQVTDLPTMTEVQFGNTLKKVMSGEWTAAIIEERVSLTESQKKAIEVAEANFKAKKAETPKTA